MKKIVMLTALAATTILIQCENDKNPKKKKEYQPVPQGAYFSITNNNSQSFNLEEKRREVSVSVQQPPVVISTQPPQQPTQQQYHQQSNPTHKGAPINQPPHTIQHEYSYSHQETRDYFVPFYDKIKKIPTLFTAKNCLIALGAVACSYAVIYFTLQYHVKNVKKNTGWGSFQEHIPPADLKSIDPLALADGIIEEIKARYPLINPANLMPSILLFNKDVEQELDELNNFIDFYTGIITYKAAPLFPNYEKLLVKAQTKIQRLNIVRDTITEWINIHVTRLMRNQPIPRHNAHEANGDETGTMNEKKCIAFLVHE